MANVFISYRPPDRSIALKLEAELATSGHNIWLDTERINIGDSIIERVNSGLLGSAYLILLLSGAGASKWMDREWMSMLARQLDGAAVKILPTLLTNGQLPAIISDLRYTNLATDWKLGVNELKAAMR